MRSAVSCFVFAAIVMLLHTGALGAPYLHEDLEALDKSGAWEELRAHLTDIPPAKRGPRWNEMAEHACLQADDDGNYDRLESCARLLAAASAADPKNKEFALRVATYFGRTRFQSLAVPFFVRAITEPGDPQCRSPEVASAVFGGLNRSETDDKALVEGAQKLAFTLCWSELQTKILVRFDRDDGIGLFERHICSALMREQVLTKAQIARCDQALH
jgi:hypothetical protein